jgi:putative ATP-dependent endonuclease of OLD family
VGSRLVASLPNFESAYLAEEVTRDKPYNAVRNLSPGSQTWQNVEQLLAALVDVGKPLPTGAIEWRDIDGLLAAVKGAA